MPNLSLRTDPLSLLFLDEAFTTPFGYDREQHHLQGSVYDRAGNRIELGVRVGGHGGDLVVNSDPPVAPPPREGARRFPGKTIYLGNLMAQFGHFITEGLSNFWPLAEIKADNYVYHPFLFGDELKPFMIPVHLALGVPTDRIHCIREPAVFERLIVPERTVILNLCVHVEHRRTIARLVDAFAPSRQRKENIFVSRSRLPVTRRTIPGEEQLDEIAARLGYRVIHPETLPISTQIEIYRNARILAGCSGSALHNVLFQEQDALLLEIGSPRLPASPHPMQTLCNMLADVESTHVPFVATPNGFDIGVMRDGLAAAMRA